MNEPMDSWVVTTTEAFCMIEDICLKPAPKGGNAHMIARVHNEKTGHRTFCRKVMEKVFV